MKNSVKAVTDGCHRICHPEQTIERMKPHLAAMGITRVANITGLDNIGIPVVTVCRPNAKAISVAQGKGQSLAAAKASGLMEAIETYHAENIDLPLRMADFRTLKQTQTVVDCDALAKLENSRFCHDKSMLWLSGENLLNKQATFVPYEIIHSDFTVPIATTGSFLMSTNGLASGNTLLEAQIHAICELIERDAVTLWFLHKDGVGEAKGKLDLTTVEDEQVLALLAKFQKAGVYVAVWDITSDIGIPAFYCSIISETANSLRPLYAISGVGCHLSKSIALSRALTEAAQCRLTLISGSRDDAKENHYKGVQSAELHQQSLRALQTPVQVDFNDIPSWYNASLEQDMSVLLSQLQKVGLNEVVSVDLTKAEFEIPVVKVVVPGLEGLGKLVGYQPGKRAQEFISQRR